MLCTLLLTRPNASCALENSSVLRLNNAFDLISPAIDLTSRVVDLYNYLVQRIKSRAFYVISNAQDENKYVLNMS